MRIVGLVPQRAAQLDAGFLRYALKRLRKADILNQHHELEHISAHAAPKAVKDLFYGVDGKGRCLFLVKGAKTPEVDASFAQLDVVSDYLDDVRCSLNFVRLIGGIS